ncbi:MAG: ATP-binding protein [Lachnospiraceae bacterium]|nr:ATP-binding protein [Lachnospiraceae bacterium]
MTELLSKLASREAQAAPGDWRDADGLLVCGVCGKRKEERVDFSAMSRRPDDIRTVPCTCGCADVADEAAREQQAFQTRITALWSAACGAHNAAALRGRIFDRDDGANPRASEVARAYCTHWAEMQQAGAGLVLFGGCGTGKTFLAGCIANELLRQRVTVCFTSVFRVENAASSAKDRQALFDALNLFDLLILDDFGSERDTAFMQGLVFGLVDARTAAGKPLLLTQNAPWHGEYAGQDMTERRIHDRLRGCCAPVELRGQSRRTAQAAETCAAVKRLLGLDRP